MGGKIEWGRAYCFLVSFFVRLQRYIIEDERKGSKRVTSLRITCFLSFN